MQGKWEKAIVEAINNEHTTRAIALIAAAPESAGLDYDMIEAMIEETLGDRALRVFEDAMGAVANVRHMPPDDLHVPVRTTAQSIEQYVRDVHRLPIHQDGDRWDGGML